MSVGNARGRTTDDYSDVQAKLEAIAAAPHDAAEHEALREEVVQRCLPLAEHIARRFDGRGEPHDDLVQVARLGLVNAVDRFDAGRGADFVSFAVPTIMGEVRRHFRDTGWAVRVPRRMKELHLSLNAAVGRLSQKLGRPPTVPELAADLDIDPGEVSDGLAAGSAYKTVSSDRPLTEDGATLLDSMGQYDEALERVEDHEALRPLLDALPERERNVVLLRFFGNMTQSEIAEKVGISQMHVSRLLARTLAQLRDQLQ